VRKAAKQDIFLCPVSGFVAPLVKVYDILGIEHDIIGFYLCLGLNTPSIIEKCIILIRLQ
jgi:hypothetical protein